MRTKKGAIARRNAAPYITCYLHVDSPNAYVVTIPKGASKKQIRLILLDAAALAGVRLTKGA